MAQTLQFRLRNVLREELSGTYSVSVNASPTWQPTESYTLTINFGSDPQRAEELVRTIFEEIDTMKTAGPGVDDVRDTRQALIRAHETRLERNNFWLGQLTATYRRGEAGAANILSYPASVEALTSAAIQEAAQRYLDTDNYVHVTLMPER